MHDEMKDIYTQFYEATSESALQSHTCAVCARECYVMEDGLSDIPLMHLPNAKHLIPQTPHPAHDLFKGKLLELSGIKVIDGQHIVLVCQHCLDDLKKSTKPPHHALTNQMWIGHVPWQLQVFSSSSCFPSELVELGTSLAFRVQCREMYYRDIEISSACIESLPEDDIPPEVTAIIRQSEDVRIIDQESDGYVPLDNDEVDAEHEGRPSPSGKMHETDEGEPSIIPLQVSGAVDMDMMTLTPIEMMAWGFANLWKEGKEGGYIMQHG
ncbi:hypothetical protein F5141DRAFT_1066907 [Pisolithus sp. B1]|nr:hypothetical protein F5141DRAFT_1066907 [Pisolithus sp. B1]